MLFTTRTIYLEMAWFQYNYLTHDSILSLVIQKFPPKPKVSFTPYLMAYNFRTIIIHKVHCTIYIILGDEGLPCINYILDLKTTQGIFH
jgi:hypothetical protein